MQDSWPQSELREIKDNSAYRSLRVYPQTAAKFIADGHEYLNFSSNDYLGLATHPRLIARAQSAIAETGCGAGASRLVTGTRDAHEEFEKNLARHVHQPSALLFGAGYLANIGLLQATVGRDDVLIADRLVHASLQDGIVVSRAQLERFAHNDLSDLETKLQKISKSRRANARVFVLTESVFSMDGDRAPLTDIANLCEQYDALLFVDEAHAIGVFGPNGAGCVVEQGLNSKVSGITATLSKSLGAFGGVVATSSDLRELLVNRARTFIFNTALPAALAESGSESLQLLSENANWGQELLQKAVHLRDLLHAHGISTLKSESQIIPLLIGDNEACVRVAEKLKARGIIAIAIRPPTVPPNSARIRLSVTLGHTQADLEHAAKIISETFVQENVKGVTDV